MASWIERHLCLPEDTHAPGKIKLAPYMRDIADAIGDAAIERVSVQKSARVGFTTVMTGAIAHYVVEDPAPILVLLPTEADCRDYIVTDIEGIFECSPALAGKLPTPTTAGRSARNTLLHRKYPGGSLKVVAGKAPRNLRRHTARVLLIDEIDAVAITAEGDPVPLAERRTMSFANRKIVVGSTPLEEGTSHVCRAYADSDRRVFEVPCSSCGAFAEIKWADIEWPPDRPELAAWRCQHCRELVGEKHKAQMVRRGRWRALRPEAGAGHAGFKINALASLLPNASWAKLAAEYLRSKDDTSTLRVFVNTVLGEPWREEADEIDETALASRVESFDLDHVPAEVLAVTVGVDVQDDRFECSILGHTRTGDVLVLAHVTLWGSPLDDDTLAELDALLRQRWRHPLGGAVKVDAAAIDAGDGGHYDAVMAFANARIGRRVLAIKGAPGFARPAIQLAKTKRGRLFIVGVDVLKSQIMQRLARGRSIRFSHTLTETYFEQLASERRVVRMARGKPVVRFERKPGMRAEALDALVYGLAANAALSLNSAAFDQRSDELRTPTPIAPPPPPAIRSQWMQRP